MALAPDAPAVWPEPNLILPPPTWASWSPPISAAHLPCLSVWASLSRSWQDPFLCFTSTRQPLVLRAQWDQSAPGPIRWLVSTKVFMEWWSCSLWFPSVGWSIVTPRDGHDLWGRPFSLVWPRWSLEDSCGTQTTLLGRQSLSVAVRFFSCFVKVLRDPFWLTASLKARGKEFSSSSLFATY